MRLGQVCSRDAPYIRTADGAREAARRMAACGIDELVVVEERDGKEVPIGTITDRDILVGLATMNIASLGELDIGTLLVAGALAGGTPTAREDEDADEVIAQMRAQGIRRMPVVDASGALVGVFGLHDALELLELMDRRPVCLSERDPARRAAALMRDKNVDLVPVCDASGRMTGTITDRELVRRLADAEASLDLPLEEVMTRDPVVFTTRDDLSSIEHRMVDHNKSRVVGVDEEGRPVCIVSLAEIARYLEDTKRRRGMHHGIREAIPSPRQPSQ